MAVRKVQRRGQWVWRARVVVGGKPATAYRSRKDEAQRAEAELRARLTEPEKVERVTTREKEVPTLSAFADEFMETYAKTNNRPSTCREKRRCLARSILPALGHLRLDEIGAREIERYKAARLGSTTRKGTKPAAKSVNEELAILGKILRLAYEWGEIEKMPPIKRLKARTPDFDFLDFDEAERLIAGAVLLPSPWCAMIPVACWTGLRISELRGLQWDDVDLVARRIHVRRAADDEGELHPPKNGRPRVVDLPRRAVEALRRHKHLRGAFVFCREDGSMLTRWECESHSKEEARDDGPIGKLCRRIGLRRVGWHVLRHTYASHLAMRGASLIEIKELLGHASLTMVLRYAHLSPSSRRAAVDLLERDDRGVTTGVTTARVEEDSRS